MLDPWFWGNPPGNFHRVWKRPGQMMLVRRGIDPDRMTSQVAEALEKPEDGTLHRGRGSVRRIRLGEDKSALVRSFIHGGIFRGVTGKYFFTWPPRPFKELAVTETIRQRGVPTLDVVAALVQRVWGPVYWGWLVTRELGDAENLWAVLCNGSYGKGMGGLLGVVAETVRLMHQQGVYHADLNLKNILVRREREDFKAYVIDFDKARVYPGALPGVLVGKNLRRLLRSVRKLDPQRRYLSDSDWASFMAYYHRRS